MWFALASTVQNNKTTMRRTHKYDAIAFHWVHMLSFEQMIIVVIIIETLCAACVCEYGIGICEDDDGAWCQRHYGPLQKSVGSSSRNQLSSYQYHVLKSLLKWIRVLDRALVRLMVDKQIARLLQQCVAARWNGCKVALTTPCERAIQMKSYFIFGIPNNRQTILVYRRFAFRLQNGCEWPFERATHKQL